jgi:hypothetical protein
MNRLILALCLISTSALGFDNGQYENVDPKIRNWFKSVRSPYGIPCCDISDGHFTMWRRSEKEGFQYEVPIEGEWHVVPPEAVITGTNNPTGETVVWYVKRSDNTLHIRCFVPGNDV